MVDIRESQGINEEPPTHEQIQKRAYELYLKSGGDGNAHEHWRIAEEELRQEPKRHNPMPSKTDTVIAGAVRKVK